MNKKIILNLILLVLLPISINAHTLLLNVFDNENNTITIEGIFNTGASATGAQVRLESLSSGELLYKQRLPDESELTVDIPKESYQIVLDGGPGHQIVQEGPAPSEGFLKSDKKEKKAKLSQERNNNNQWSIALIFTIALAFILLFITIFISIKNTNKLMKELKHSS